MPTIKKNGVSFEESRTFQSFVVKCRAAGAETSGLEVHLPIKIVRYLKLKPDELLLVAIRRISQKEAKLVYGDLPRGRSRSSAGQVTCPVCGRRGSLAISNGRYFRVDHRKKHGFSKPIVHCISKTQHTSFYEEWKGKLANQV